MKTYADITNERLVALRRAREAAEKAAHELARFERRFGKPRTISGERLNAEQHAEWRRLDDAQQAAWNSYQELRANTQ